MCVCRIGQGFDNRFADFAPPVRLEKPDSPLVAVECYRFRVTKFTDSTAYFLLVSIY